MRGWNARSAVVLAAVLFTSSATASLPSTGPGALAWTLSKRDTDST